MSDEEVTSPRTLRGGDYRTSSDADGVTLHPYLRTDGYSWNYIYNIYACCLLRRDPNTLELVPDMAESYTVAEDGLTFTFKLRKNIQWSDGTPMTAQDFKWTFDQAIKPENENPVLTEMQFIKSYEALDDYTIQARIDRIFAPALENISNLVTPLPKHIWEGSDLKILKRTPISIIPLLFLVALNWLSGNVTNTLFSKLMISTGIMALPILTVILPK